MKLSTSITYKKIMNKSFAFESLINKLAGSKTALVYTVLVGIIVVITGILMPFFTKIFVDHILLGNNRDWLILLLIGMAITTVIRGGLIWLQEHYLYLIERKISFNSAKDFFLNILKLPTLFFQTRYIGDIAKRIDANEKIAEFLSIELIHYIIYALMSVFYLILMLQYDVTLSLFGVSVAVINFLILRCVAKKRSNRVKEMLRDRGKHTGIILSGLKNIQTIKAAGLESDYLNLKTGFQAKIFDSEGKFIILEHYLHVIHILLANLTNIVVLILGCYKILNGQMTIGVLVAFQSLMASFLGPINHLVALKGKFVELEGELHHINDVLEYKEEDLLYKSESEAIHESNSRLNGDVELIDLCFRYTNEAECTLKNLNMSIKAGSWIAITGETGSGKSTLAKVIAGLYKPISGKVLIDGVALSDLPRSVLTQSIKIIDQDIFLFEGSIRDNITLWDKTITEWAIIRSAKDTLLHDEISIREDRYEHMVLEGGINFSGGQCQRLEIARALVHNPSILILDETLSLLDPLTEEALYRNIRERGCTVIAITHNLSTIKNCDEIFRMENGSIIKMDTYGELMKEQKL